MNFHAGKPDLQCLKHSKKIIAFSNSRSTDSSVVLWEIQQRKIPEKDISPTLKADFFDVKSTLTIGDVYSCQD